MDSKDCLLGEEDAALFTSTDAQMQFPHLRALLGLADDSNRGSANPGSTQFEADNQRRDHRAERP
jgi:hypothetical protein